MIVDRYLTVEIMLATDFLVEMSSGEKGGGGRYREYRKATQDVGLETNSMFFLVWDNAICAW